MELINYPGLSGTRLQDLSVFTNRQYLGTKDWLPDSSEDMAARNLWDYEEQAASLVIPPELIHARKRPLPVAILLFGNRGKGKTLAMSYLGAMQRILWDLHGPKTSSWRVLSNYQLKFANWDVDMIDKIAGPAGNPFLARKALLCIDEIQTAFPSRRSLASINLFFTRFIEQIRKLPCEIMFTVQKPQVVDKDLLYQCDLFIETDIDLYNDEVVLYIYDHWGDWTGRRWRKPWPPDRKFADWVRVLPNVSAMFNMYRSNEYIPPTWHKMREQLLMAQGIIRDGQNGDDSEMTEETVEQSLGAELKRYGYGWNVNALLSIAQQYYPEIKPTGFREWLTGNGYSIRKSNRLFYAERA